VVVDEQPERDQGERDGHEEQAAAQPARVEPIGGAAGGERDEHVGGGPGRVEHRELAVGADRDLVEVGRVRRRPQCERQREDAPRRAGGAAGDHQHGDHEREHGEVAERIREVGRDGRERALGAGDDAEHGRGADRGAGECTDDPVEPQRGAEPRRPGA